MNRLTFRGETTRGEQVIGAKRPGTRLAGVMFCAFLGVLEVPVLAGLMLLSKDLFNICA